MGARTEPGITVEQTSALLRLASEERDQAFFAGTAVAFLAGCVSVAVYVGVAEIIHRRYASEYKRIRLQVEQQMRRR